MATKNEVFTGDDVDVEITITLDGNPVSIDPGASIEAAIVNRSKTQRLTPVVSVPTSGTGVDLQNGILIASFSRTDTAGIDVTGDDSNVGQAFVVARIEQNGKRSTGFDEITILAGLIDLDQAIVTP